MSDQRPRVVLATRNQHKVPEIRRILALAGADVDLVSVAEFDDVDDFGEARAQEDEAADDRPDPQPQASLDATSCSTASRTA